MKKILKIAILAIASMAVIASCSLLSGKDGKAYVQVTFDLTQADAVMGSFGGLPSDGEANTEYEVAPGSYTGDNVLYWSTYIFDAHGAGSYLHYHTYFNGPSFYTDYGYIYGPSVSSNLSYYSGTFYSTYHNDLSYTVTVKKGSFPFRSGADSHFTLYLDWDPILSTISSSTVPASKARIIEDSSDRIVKELTDGDYTLRLEMKKGNSPEPKSLKNTQ